MIAMTTLCGGLLGAMGLAGPALMRCGTDPDCMFRMGGLALRGGVLGVIVGLVAGLLLGMMTQSKKRSRDDD